MNYASPIATPWTCDGEEIGMSPDEQACEMLAHTGVDGRQHGLREHLLEVASLAATNAAGFNSENWARLAGLWHDLGKYRSGFQKYIRQSHDADAHIEGRVGGRDKTHSAAGALWAQRYLPEKMGKEGQVAARVLSYLIAGHHAGLDNWFQGLNDRFASDDAQREFRDTSAAPPPADILCPDSASPDLSALPIDGKNGKPPGSFALWIRMLFSSLVDADFLDTERFLDGDKFASRAGHLSVAEMAKRFDHHMASTVEALRVRGEDGTQVNRVRAEVLQQCRNKAKTKPGVFTLTVPTGGGKTLSSLAFALGHAAAHNKRRIIYAIPYTSIIEQTADIFRGIFGDDNIVEHHSNVE